MAESRFYSQHGEDRFLIDGIFRDLADGVFVDVGASDGVLYSNTLALEERGWRGVCVEPVPALHGRLRGNRPKATCLHCAVGYAELGGHEQYAGAGIGGPVVDGSPAIFYVRKSGAQDISGFTRSDNTDYYPIVVTQRTLSGILAQFGLTRVDLLSVDTEGTEVDALRSLDFVRWRPRVIVAEFATIHYGDTRGPLSAFLVGVGYRVVAEMGGNLIVVDKSGD